MGTTSAEALPRAAAHYSSARPENLPGEWVEDRHAYAILIGPLSPSPHGVSGQRPGGLTPRRLSVIVASPFSSQPQLP